jgi:very-short-patch-repair endonuclease
VPIGRYVADFASFEAKLIVELDGSQHIESGRDRVRDAELESRGFEVLRILNADLFLQRDGVLTVIHSAVVARTGSEDALR